MKVTITAIKADIGGFVGHSSCHPDVVETVAKKIKNAKETKLLIDYDIRTCGDDIFIVMTHTNGVDSEKVHKLAWDAFVDGTAVAKDLKLYGAGQDLLKDAFSGNVKGMGPGCAEMEFEERLGEPVIVFMADKTSPGAWNFPLFKMFGDPMNTAGLVIDPSMHDGFIFEVLDIYENKIFEFYLPEEMYDLLVFIGAAENFVIRRVWRKSDKEIGAISSTQKLNLIAGKYIGKDDPVLIVRCQSGMPAVGEALEPFCFPHIVAGWMRGSHQGPLMPVSFKDATPSRFDGPPRVIAAGYQLSSGRLVGPRDMFDDPGFDNARQIANDIADYFRRHGAFEPHRLPLGGMEYTTMPQVMKKLEERAKKIPS